MARTEAVARQSVLPQLGLRPDQVGRMRGRHRTRILNFLLRWEYFQELHACLDAAVAAAPARVSLLDLRASAYLAQERPARALEVLRQRLLIRTSILPRTLLARAHLAMGQIEESDRVSAALLTKAPKSVFV